MTKNWWNSCCKVDVSPLTSSIFLLNFPLIVLQILVSRENTMPLGASYRYSHSYVGHSRQTLHSTHVWSNRNKNACFNVHHWHDLQLILVQRSDLLIFNSGSKHHRAQGWIIAARQPRLHFKATEELGGARAASSDPGDTARLPKPHQVLLVEQSETFL